MYSEEYSHAWAKMLSEWHAWNNDGINKHSSLILVNKYTICSESWVCLWRVSDGKVKKKKGEQGTDIHIIKEYF